MSRQRPYGWWWIGCDHEGCDHAIFTQFEGDALSYLDEWGWMTSNYSESPTDFCADHGMRQFIKSDRGKNHWDCEGLCKCDMADRIAKSVEGRRERGVDLPDECKETIDE